MTIRPPKKPEDLTKAQLVGIVASLQAHMFLEVDAHDVESWNPDKEVSGADLVEALSINLDHWGLVPERIEPH